MSAGQLQQLRRPPWMRVKVRKADGYKEVHDRLRRLRLNTVCEEASCPNIWECWGEHRTATFMLLGEICTRACRYCDVASGRPLAPDPDEPTRVAEAVAQMELQHVVLTSVDRDDLEDCGSSHWATTVAKIFDRCDHRVRVEVLTPDFQGDPTALHRVLDTGLHVFGHNLETVPRVFRRVRAKGDYQRSLQVLHAAHAYRVERSLPLQTKSGIMLGLGESEDEVRQVMDDLREVNCNILTMGQYLNPSRKHAPIQRFYEPEVFAQLREDALERGFSHVESGPLVRSSYHAHEHSAGQTR